MKLYECWDCGGSGVKAHYYNVKNGVCFTCNGSGKTNKIPSATDFTEADYLGTRYKEFCDDCGAMPCHCEQQTKNEKVEMTMNNRDKNVQVFTSVVALLSKSANRMGVLALTKYTAIHADVSEAYAHRFIVLMHRKNMLSVTETGLRGGMTLVSLTKEACDKYRELSASLKMSVEPKEGDKCPCMECGTEVTHEVNGWIEYCAEENRTECLCAKCDSYSELDDEYELEGNQYDNIKENPSGIVGFRDGIE